MTIKIEFTEDDLGVVFDEEGTVSAEEITAAMKQVYRDDRYPELKYWIINATAESNTTTFADINDLAQLEVKESIRNSGLFLAIVTDTDHIYALTRMYEAFAHESTSTIKIFTNRENADEWVVSEINSSASNQHSENKKSLRLN